MTVVQVHRSLWWYTYKGPLLEKGGGNLKKISAVLLTDITDLTAMFLGEAIIPNNGPTHISCFLYVEIVFSLLDIFTQGVEVWEKQSDVSEAEFSQKL